jgi:hypothetical protein
MVHEKRGSKEDSGDSGRNEPKKCKSHLFKEAYDLARKKKMGGGGGNVCVGTPLTTCPGPSTRPDTLCHQPDCRPHPFCNVVGR